MNWRATKRSLNILQLFPVPLLLLSVLWGSTFIILGTLLLPGDTEQPSSHRTNDRLSEHLSTHQKKTTTLRLHIVGPGRAKNWAPEHIRNFHFVNELKFRSEFTGASPPPFSENRHLVRYRSLLISSSTDEKLQLKWGITEILKRIGSSDKLLPIGQEGYPITPIQPEKLNETERSKLMDFIQGSSKKKSIKNVIRFISPLEGKHISLHHQIRNGTVTTSLPERFNHISGLERNVLVHAPIAPEIYLPSTKTARETVKNGTQRSIVISGFDRYVRSFFQSRLNGSLKLAPKEVTDSQITYSGSGSFNMFLSDKQHQIGEISVERITLVQRIKRQLITNAEINGQMAVTSFPSGHILQRIQFLRTPEFRISYSVHRPEDHD